MSTNGSDYDHPGSREEKTPASQVSDPGNLIRTPMFNHYSIIDKSRVVSLRWYIPHTVFGRAEERLQMAYAGTDEKGQPTLHWEDVPIVVAEGENL